MTASCILVAFTLVFVSSEECNTNIFYDFMYCLSSNSQCAQCIPCYNNAPLYIPTGKRYATSCTDNDMCTECTANCATDFNDNKYHKKYIQNTYTDHSCPILKNFIGEMNSTTLTNIDTNTQYQYDCDTDYVLSIKYGIIAAINYTQNEAQNCTLDISYPLKQACDQLQSCTFNIHPYIPNTCDTSHGFNALIGSFCVSMKAPNKLEPEHEEASNSIPLSDGLIWTLIILPWCLIIIALILLIYYLMYHQCMQCKKVSDSKRKLNKKLSSERVDSETVVTPPINNKMISIETPSAHHHHPPHKASPVHPTHSTHSNNNRKHVRDGSSSKPHKYHPQQQHRSRNAVKSGNRTKVPQMRYQNIMNNSTSSMNATAQHPNVSSPQDSMVVHFQRKAVGQTGIKYQSYNEGFDPAIPITNERHNRNTSVIMPNTGPLTQHINGGAWAQNGQQLGVDYLVKQHPALNQSDVIPHQAMGDTVLSSYDGVGAVDELAHSLIYQRDIEQKQYYDHYWNQYYGIPPQPQQSQFHSDHHLESYPDFANPNGDYNMNLSYDSSKVEMILQNEIQLEAEIGRGSSSKVFKARWRNAEVAAKRFAATVGIDAKKAKQYIDKYAMKVNENQQENVIKILAFSDKPFTILTEYMNKGSVKNYVRRTRPGSTSISILDRIEIALQAAKGIHHLHKLGIIHSEINCQNLLMEITNNDKEKEKIRVVVTDYALQNILSSDELETYRSSLGPLKWMAPECIENSSSPTTFESDIYAFGITMWEIITGQEPYPDVDPVDTAIHVLVKERRPQSYAFIPEKIQNLMKMCWHKFADQRPNANKVVKELNQFIQIERKQNAERNDLQ